MTRTLPFPGLPLENLDHLQKHCTILPLTCDLPFQQSSTPPIVASCLPRLEKHLGLFQISKVKLFLKIHLYGVLRNMRLMLQNVPISPKNLIISSDFFCFLNLDRSWAIIRRYWNHNYFLRMPYHWILCKKNRNHWKLLIKQ